MEEMLQLSLALLQEMAFKTSQAQLPESVARPLVPFTSQLPPLECLPAWCVTAGFHTPPSSPTSLYDVLQIRKLRLKEIKQHTQRVSV